MAIELSSDWEARFLQRLQGLLGETGCKALGVFSVLGEPAFIFFVFCFLYFGFRKQAGIRTGIVVLTALVWNPMVKNLALRLRPYMAHPGIRCVRPAVSGDLYDPEVQGYSFPSGHATVVSAAGGILSRLFRKRWVYAMSAAAVILVSLSRMALGVHYPTDVLFGIMLGAVSVFIVELLRARIPNTKVLYLILALTTVPGFFYCTSEDFFSCTGLLYGFFLGNLFEERYVCFRDIKNFGKVLLRVLLAALVFLCASYGVKLVFGLLPGELSRMGILRTIRYFLAAFTVTGLYPLCFRRLRLEEADFEAEA